MRVVIFPKLLLDVDEEPDELGESEGEDEEEEADEAEEDAYDKELDDNDKTVGGNQRNQRRHQERHQEEADDDDEDAEYEYVDETSNSKKRKSSVSSPPPQPPTSRLDARVRFATNLFLLNGVELGHVICTLEDAYPNALDHGGVGKNRSWRVPNRLEVVIDNIDGDTFVKLSLYVAEKVSQWKRSRTANQNTPTTGAITGGGTAITGGLASGSATPTGTSTTVPGGVGSSAQGADGYSNSPPTITDVSQKRKRKK